MYIIFKARTYFESNGKKRYSTYSNVATCDIDEFLTALKLKANYNVRSAPSSNHRVVGTVKRDQIVVSCGRVANYYKIKVNGKFGYIHKNYLTVYNDAKVLSVSNINQFSNQGGAPLPMGCEATSLAVVLQYLGFNKVTKNLLVDKYQPRGTVGYTDPNVAFVGTPYSSRPYGCYAPVIVKTAENYFKAIGNNEYQVNNLTGLNIDEIYKEIDKGTPLVMWITCGIPYKQESWTLRYGTKTTKLGTGTYRFTWYGLQHCVAVAGYNKKKNTLIIADVGKAGELTEYSISSLRQGYNVLGKQLVSITKK